MGTVIRYGVARGVFSNESGLGSAPMYHGQSRNEVPVKEGLVAMLGPFIDTLIICTMTALAIIMIPVVLLARFVAVGVPLSLLRRWREYTPHAVKILTWAGVRGGISVALALSWPPGPARQVFLPMTYVIVLFSILVQGLSVGRAVRWAAARG